MLRPIVLLRPTLDRHAAEASALPRRWISGSPVVTVPLAVSRSDNRLARSFAWRLRDAARAVVISGGMLGDEARRPYLDFWAKAQAPIIFWGAGLHASRWPTGREPDESDYGDLMSGTVTGVRDAAVGFTWVPCASCRLPALAQRPSVREGTLLLLRHGGRADRTRVEELVRQDDAAELIWDDEPTSRIIARLARARTVVTDDYHGAYWATLLGKPVVGLATNPTLRGLKHAPAVAEESDWVGAVSEASVHPHALEECRDRNGDFAADVAPLLRTASVRTGAYQRDPIVERAKAVPARPTVPQKSPPVPRTVHFVFGLSPTFGGKPFNMMHYLAVRSVAERFGPDRILFHHEYEPDNEFYARARPYLTPNKVVAPEEYRGNPIHHFAHKADIIRLEQLLDKGGIYLDLDTVTVKSLDPMLAHEVTMGLQGRDQVEGLCNAVVAAAPGSPFIADWLSRYAGFNDAEWDRFSVKLPYLMWRSGKHDINVEPYDRFHWPLWHDDGLKMMFEEDHRFDAALCHHLWESKSFARYFGDEGFEAATERLKRSGSTYSRLVADLL